MQLCCQNVAGRTDRSSRALFFMSRLLMGLIATLLLVAPWTECHLQLDDFPHGQDFELSMFVFLALLCLVLLLAEQCRRGVAALFSLWAHFGLVLRSVLPAMTWASLRLTTDRRDELLSCTGFDGCVLPLLI